MNILLIGEFSGIYKNLKSGLEHLGHDVTLLANGDGWKQIPGSDGLLFRPASFTLTRFWNRLIAPFFDKRLFKNYDAVFIVNISIFNPIILPSMLKKLKKKNKALFLSACGDDYALYRAYLEGTFEYFVFDGDSYNRYQQSKWWKKYGPKRELSDIAKYFDQVIPTGYEYQIGYTRAKCETTKCIPLPIDLNDCKYHENTYQGKIVIFHGLNREGAKGSKFILEALTKIEERYRDNVEIIADGKMPYAQYLEVINKANIVVDQCQSYGYGINACIAMAMGKVVLSGCTDENLASFGMMRQKCPIIPIRPDVGQIEHELGKLITRSDELPALGRQSRQFIEEYHDAKKVALKYVEIIKKRR